MKVKIPPKVTASAFNKIMSIGGKKCLRVAVEGGGCSGFQYEISMDSDIKENDLILSENECRVVIGSKFVIENPNATSSCGCGTSFSI